tara:strand:+ start:408 stop:1205 length:798 start_codon:yes stop_codon:yes gene_type:complete
MNTSKITIRPSSLSEIGQCSYRWYKTHIEGEQMPPSSRANIGTAIHRGAEVFWTDAIKSGKKDNNLRAIQDAAIQQYQESEKEGNVFYKDRENKNTAEKEVVNGTKAFLTDIVPKTDIPLAVEKRLSYEVDHPLVARVSGTVDYITSDTIADLKTSGRKISPQDHVLQQSIYNFLAVKNGIKVDKLQIQSIILSKTTPPRGEIMSLTPNIPQALYITNHLLDSLKVAHEGKVDPKLLFRGNPKYFLCSDAYCSQHSTCPFVNGEK